MGESIGAESELIMSMPRKLRCTVESIIDHGGRVYTLDLKPEASVPQFRPGQFLHLTVDEYDPSSFWPESRVFSIASSPSERKRIRICYSVKGRYTTKMEHTLKSGGTVWIKLPYGDFTIVEDNDAVLIAGGTGISAFTAFIDALRPESTQKVTLLYGARNHTLLLYKEMLLDKYLRCPSFKLLFFIEEANPVFVAELLAQSRPPLCFTGRINLDSIFPSSASTLNSSISASALIYLSGPPVMLNVFSGDLKTRGIAAEKIRTDAWE